VGLGAAFADQVEVVLDRIAATPGIHAAGNRSRVEGDKCSLKSPLLPHESKKIRGFSAITSVFNSFFLWPQEF
jgi:hypothetical protein